MESSFSDNKRAETSVLIEALGIGTHSADREDERLRFSENQEFNKRLLGEVERHLERRNHPLIHMINIFSTEFNNQYMQMVNPQQTSSRQMLAKIQAQGEDFITSVFQQVKEF